MLAGFLVGIIAFQLLLQRVVLLPADETLLVRCLRRSLQTFGQHFAFACENGVLRALTGNVIVRCSWFYPPDPFDLDAIRKLSPCSSRSCQRKRPWLRSLCRKGPPGLRNQYLADILESTSYEGGFVAENRGTGFKLMGLELERNQMEAPVVRDSVAMFSLEFRRHKDQLSIGSSYDEIVSFVSANEPCGAGEISAGLNIPRSTVTYRLKKLVGEKRLERIGTERSRNQKYRLP